MDKLYLWLGIITGFIGIWIGGTYKVYPYNVIAIVLFIAAVWLIDKSGLGKNRK